MNIFLIINNSGSNLSDVIKDRIKTIGNGDFYHLQSDLYFVKTEMKTAKEVYSSIVKTDYPTLSLVVMSIDPRVDISYWGRSKHSFWSWLKDIKISHK